MQKAILVLTIGITILNSNSSTFSHSHITASLLPAGAGDGGGDPLFTEESMKTGQKGGKGRRWRYKRHGEEVEV